MSLGLPGRASPTRTERGAGLISTLFGVGVLMVLLGTSVNVALGLWARSSVDAIAYDAARSVATAPSATVTSVAESDALAQACDLLGSRCGDVTLRFEHDGSTDVVLRVHAAGVNLLPRMLARGPLVADLDRRLVIHRESP